MIEHTIIFVSGFICGLFLWLKTGIQNWLSAVQMNKLIKKLDKPLVVKDAKIDKFMNETWIPMYIMNYVDAVKSVKDAELEDFLTEFYNGIKNKQQELWDEDKQWRNE